MSITRDDALSETNNNVTAIQNAADANFIANVDSQIQQAISLGQYQVCALTNPENNLINVYNHYADLGYTVFFPDFANQNGAQLPSIMQQPQNFFGSNWVAFWAGLINTNLVTNPARMVIAWSSYSPPVQTSEPV